MTKRVEEPPAEIEFTEALESSLEVGEAAHLSEVISLQIHVVLEGAIFDKSAGSHLSRGNEVLIVEPF